MRKVLVSNGIHIGRRDGLSERTIAMMTVDWFRAIVSQIVWIGIGAVLGANARYFISLWMAGRADALPLRYLSAILGPDFPYGTLVVNASGSLLLGFLVAAGSHYLTLSPPLRLMMMVGFLGSFTTFSTFAVESVAFWQNERAWVGLVNILANNGISLLCAALGILLARQFLNCDLCD